MKYLFLSLILFLFWQTAFSRNIVDNELVLGKGDSQDVFIYADTGAMNQPFFRFNFADQVWELSTDGITAQEILSGILPTDVAQIGDVKLTYQEAIFPWVPLDGRDIFRDTFQEMFDIMQVLQTQTAHQTVLPPTPITNGGFGVSGINLPNDKIAVVQRTSPVLYNIEYDRVNRLLGTPIAYDPAVFISAPSTRELLPEGSYFPFFSYSIVSDTGLPSQIGILEYDSVLEDLVAFQQFTFPEDLLRNLVAGKKNTTTYLAYGKNGFASPATLKILEKEELAVEFTDSLRTITFTAKSQSFGTLILSTVTEDFDFVVYTTISLFPPIRGLIEVYKYNSITNNYDFFQEIIDSTDLGDITQLRLPGEGLFFPTGTFVTYTANENLCFYDLNELETEFVKTNCVNPVAGRSLGGDNLEAKLNCSYKNSGNRPDKDLPIETCYVVIRTANNVHETYLVSYDRANRTFEYVSEAFISPRFNSVGPVWIDSFFYVFGDRITNINNNTLDTNGRLFNVQIKKPLANVPPLATGITYQTKVE